MIFYAFAVVCSAPTQPTQEILNNSIIKLYKLRESKETILMFDSYKDELEYFLKEQERSTRVESNFS